MTLWAGFYPRPPDVAVAAGKAIENGDCIAVSCFNPWLVSGITGGRDLRHSQSGHSRRSILKEHDLAVQTRRLDAGNGCTGHASFGSGFVLVAHGGGEL